MATLAVLAIGPIAASSAAAEGTFTAAEPAALTLAPIGPLTLKIPITETLSRELSCAESQFAGTLPFPPQKTLQIQSMVGNCSSKFTGGPAVPATFFTNGCTLTLTTYELVSATTATVSAGIDCAAGKEIEITSYLNEAEHKKGITSCVYKIPPQSVAGAFESHNLGSGTGEDIELTMKLGLSIKLVKGSKAVCGIAKEGTSTVTYGDLTLSAHSLGFGTPIGVMIG